MKIWKEIGAFRLDEFIKSGKIKINNNLFDTQMKQTNAENALYDYFGQVNISNKFDGFGRLCIYNKHMYEGQFSNGKECGFGRCIYENCEYYEGMWEDGQPHG